MLVTFYLFLVLYEFASLSVSQKVLERQVVDTINCPPTKCINLWTKEEFGPPKRCCGGRVNPLPIMPGGQIVPSFAKVRIPAEVENLGSDPNFVYLEGDFPPGQHGLVSYPKCTGWYDLGEDHPQEWSFDESYQLIGKDGNVMQSNCLVKTDILERLDALKPSPNPYYIPSLNPLERARVELEAPWDFRGYNEPIYPSILINPGSSIIKNPTIHTFNQLFDSLEFDSGTPSTTQGLLISPEAPDTTPADVASTTDL